MNRLSATVLSSCVVVLFLHTPGLAAEAKAGVKIGERQIAPVEFTLRSVKSGPWSDVKTWNAGRVPAASERVLISRDTRVVYDVESPAVLRLVQVAGTLSFARDRNTTLNVGMLKVQNAEVCSEDGFACDLHDATENGEPVAAPAGPLPVLEVGTPGDPLPAQFTARIRLHYLEGMNKDNAPALACCAGRLELHGSPLSRTWLNLGADAKPGESEVTLSEPVTGWRVGDEVIVTGSKHYNQSEIDFRREPEKLDTETRHIKQIEGTRLVLDAPLERPHQGSGPYRSEVANLSRNVVVESADPAGVRGHTVYHQFSRGGISYARFAHLGKEGVLGRYAIHFHLTGDSMRGSGVVGAAIVDSHNRWITIHGTNFLVVRDCVGFRSVGHGFFLEDGTEAYNVLDRNLGVQAVQGKRLPKQVLPFDPNEGAAFWWANGRNTLVRNTACENHEYGYRYQSEKHSNFNPVLPVLMPDGKEQAVDIRTLPIFRFEQNESHSEGLYSFVFAGADRAGPDTKHPHVLRNLTAWNTHYALRSQLPTMLIEKVRIDHAVYGVYRPEFLNHVYRDLSIGATNTEPFNRGLDDDSSQWGSMTVENLTFNDFYNNGLPLVQMSDNNPSGTAESHFRHVKAVVLKGEPQRRSTFDRGGGAQVEPTTAASVPVFVHDYFGPGRTAKIVSTHAQDFTALAAAEKYLEQAPLTGPTSRVAEVGAVEFPKLLDPVDDLPPSSVITWPSADYPAKLEHGSLIVRGTTTDNEHTARVLVNGVPAENRGFDYHEWEVKLTGIKPGKLEITAAGADAAGNVERMPHRIAIAVE